MKFWLALAAALVIQLPAAASAGVDVDPSTVSPRLFIEATQIEVYRAHQFETGSSKDGGGSLLRAINFSCKVDALLPLYGCRTTPPRKPSAPGAQLTEGQILRAVREIGMPRLQVRVQPGTATLVNIPTIFYTEPQDFRRSIDLLGFDIDLVAEPVQYRWSHGDGTAATTSRPGKPYPSTDVTHRYRETAENVSPRVDVTYRVRYRVDGGAWSTLDQTLLATGPSADLEVKEAAPVLTKP